MILGLLARLIWTLACIGMALLALGIVLVITVSLIG